MLEKVKCQNCGTELPMEITFRARWFVSWPVILLGCIILALTTTLLVGAGLAVVMAVIRTVTYKLSAVCPNCHTTLVVKWW